MILEAFTAPSARDAGAILLAIGHIGEVHVDELVHERVTERHLTGSVRAYPADSYWESPDSSTPHCWQLLEAARWSPATTAGKLADSLDRVTNALIPGATDGTFDVTPRGVGEAMFRDDTETTAVQAPGPDQPWVPWRNNDGARSKDACR